MKRLTILLLWFAAVLPLAAQTAHRDSVLAQARYLKSIYRTDEAIELMSGLVQPDVSLGGGTKTVNSGGTGLNLRKGPGTGYDVIRSIGDGYPVAVKGKSSTVSGWVYVTDITRGVSGWVASAYLD